MHVNMSSSRVKLQKDETKNHGRVGAQPSAPPSWSNQTQHAQTSKAATTTEEETRAAKKRMEQLLAWRAKRDSSNQTSDDTMTSKVDKLRLLDRQPASFKQTVPSDIALSSLGDAKHTRRLCHEPKATSVNDPPRPSSRHLRNFQFGPIEEKYVRQRDGGDVDHDDDAGGGGVVPTEVPTPETPPNRRKLAIKLDFSSPGMDHDDHHTSTKQVIPATFNPNQRANSSRQHAPVDSTSSRHHHVPVYQAHTIASLNHQRAMAERAAKRSADQQLQVQSRSRQGRVEGVRGRAQRSKSQESSHGQEGKRQLHRSKSQTKSWRPDEDGAVPSRGNKVMASATSKGDLDFEEGGIDAVDDYNNFDAPTDKCETWDRDQNGHIHPTEDDVADDKNQHVEFEKDVLAMDHSAFDGVVMSPEDLDDHEVLSDGNGNDVAQYKHIETTEPTLLASRDQGLDLSNQSACSSPQHEANMSSEVQVAGLWTTEDSHDNLFPNSPQDSPTGDSEKGRSTLQPNDADEATNLDIRSNVEDCPSYQEKAPSDQGYDDRWHQSSPASDDNNMWIDQQSPSTDHHDPEKCLHELDELVAVESTYEASPVDNPVDSTRPYLALEPLSPMTITAMSPPTSTHQHVSPKASPLLTSQTSGIPSSRPEVPYALDLDLIHPVSPRVHHPSTPPILHVYESPGLGQPPQTTPPSTPLTSVDAVSPRQQPLHELQEVATTELRQRPIRRNFLGLTPPQPISTSSPSSFRAPELNAVHTPKGYGGLRYPHQEEPYATTHQTDVGVPDQHNSTKSTPTTTPIYTTPTTPVQPTTPPPPSHHWAVSPLHPTARDNFVDMATSEPSQSADNIAPGTPLSQVSAPSSPITADPMAEWAWEPDYVSPPPSPQFISSGGSFDHPSSQLTSTHGETVAVPALFESPTATTTPNAPAQDQTVTHESLGEARDPTGLLLPHATSVTSSPPADIPPNAPAQNVFVSPAVKTAIHEGLGEARDPTGLLLPHATSVTSSLPGVPTIRSTAEPRTAPGPPSPSSSMSWVDILLRAIVGAGCVAVAAAALHVQASQTSLVQSKLHHLVADVESLTLQAAAYDQRLASWGASLARDLDANARHLHQDTTLMQKELEDTFVLTKERNALAMADVQDTLASVLEQVQHSTETSAQATLAQVGLASSNVAGSSHPSTSLPQFLHTIQQRVQQDQATLHLLRNSKADMEMELLRYLNASNDDNDVCATDGDEMCRLGVQLAADHDVALLEDDLEAWTVEHNRAVDTWTSEVGAAKTFLHSILLVELGIVVLMWMLWRLRHVHLSVDSDDIVFIPHMGRDDHSVLSSSSGDDEYSDDDDDVFIIARDVGPKTPDVTRHLKFQPTPRSVRRSPRLEEATGRGGYY
ncbi:hypothetical protein H257_17961 [Aphanomyces astaci]|uniref:Uncharacterized protein n=1 Tax=Aphanomyces astaci TaxID=112090 RepID=W4FCP4_APHAT|nr:hypothetical protein H257_17961 [Aphanomyces astaci]ETV65240.1 hypothetical protein H257_17961 [Aphanomyces astaci]|eukprot:XP_009845241.1 hypothetical protein H257_17961 [Aphanomyces astaci]